MKFLKAIFFVLVCVSVTAAFWVFKDLLFPFVTSKAFFFRIAIELAFPLYAYFLVVDGRLRPNLKNPLNLAMLAFMLLNFASAFSGVNLTRSLWGNFERMGGAYYIAHLVALYFYILCLGQMGSWYLQWFLKVLLWVGIVVAGNGIFGWLGWPTLVLDPTLPTRVSSTLGNPIYLGSFLIIPFFLSLFFGHQTDSGIKRAGYYFLGFLCLLGIFLSGTRGAAVGLLSASFLGALIYLFFNPSKKIKIYGFALVGICVIAAGLLFVNHEKLPQGSTVRRLFNLNDSNTQSRLLQWKVALRGFEDRPLLGTGPENYYIVANQYYDPKIAEFDPSWFDKPHNYLLEILVTDGILGFAAYMGILIFLVFALYKGFKSGLYGLLEFCFLLTALLAYQIQNLFVFDTVPTSLMFFAFAGFGGYIWQISRQQESGKPKIFVVRENRAFGVSVLVVCLLLMLYAEYATNLLPMRISKNVNYGYAYAFADLNKAHSYFQTAVSLPFNFDEAETASKFAEFAANIARSSTEQNRALALKILDESTVYLENVTKEQVDSPVLWQRLSMAYLFKSTQVGDKIIVHPKAEEAIKKAIGLAPSRDEASLTLAQIRSLEGKFAEAETILLKALQNIPSDRSARLQIINLYRAQNKIDLAVAKMEELFKQGYKFSQYQEVKWLVGNYADKKEFDRAIDLQRKAGETEPGNLLVFIDLAKLYALAGKYGEAINLAQSIIKFEPSRQKEMQELIDSLPKTASSTPASN